MPVSKKIMNPELTSNLNDEDETDTIHKRNLSSQATLSVISQQVTNMLPSNSDKVLKGIQNSSELESWDYWYSKTFSEATQQQKK